VFDDKENLIGVALLALCAVVGGVLVYSIVTGERFEYNGPRWLVWVLAVLFIGGILYGMLQGFSSRWRSGGSPQWPDPGSGRKPWWMFWRNR
jgi:hypothetical protein